MNTDEVDAIIGGGVIAGGVVILTTKVDVAFIEDVDTASRFVGFKAARKVESAQPVTKIDILNFYIKPF